MVLGKLSHVKQWPNQSSYTSNHLLAKRDEYPCHAKQWPTPTSLTFLPLPLDFNFTQEESWVALVKHIQDWLLNVVLDTHSQEWLWHSGSPSSWHIPYFCLDLGTQGYCWKGHLSKAGWIRWMLMVYIPRMWSHLLGAFSQRHWALFKEAYGRSSTVWSHCSTAWAYQQSAASFPTFFVHNFSPLSRHLSLSLAPIIAPTYSFGVLPYIYNPCMLVHVTLLGHFRTWESREGLTLYIII